MSKCLADACGWAFGTAVHCVSTPTIGIAHKMARIPIAQAVRRSATPSLTRLILHAPGACHPPSRAGECAKAEMRDARQEFDACGHVADALRYDAQIEIARPGKCAEDAVDEV